MRYALVREMDISNGEGIGCSLFVQGCPFHCSGCFNPETWDFNGGKEWTEEIETKFIFNIMAKPYIKRVSILGGEPFADQNWENTMLLCKGIKSLYPEKRIWIYSGYKYEDLILTDKHQLFLYLDVLVDGRFKKALFDPTLKFRGSSNQRIIDVQKSLEENKIVLYRGKEYAN